MVHSSFRIHSIQILKRDEARVVLIEKAEHCHDLLLSLTQVKRLLSQLDECVEVNTIVTFALYLFTVRDSRENIKHQRVLTLYVDGFQVQKEFNERDLLIPTIHVGFKGLSEACYFRVSYLDFHFEGCVIDLVERVRAL